MGIRRLWLRIMERAAPRRSLERERILVIRRVLKQLRDRQRALMGLRDAVMDDEQRSDLADKLIVLRAQRAKGIALLRELRGEGRVGVAYPPPGAEATGRRRASEHSVRTEHKFHQG